MFLRVHVCVCVCVRTCVRMDVYILYIHCIFYVLYNECMFGVLMCISCGCVASMYILKTLCFLGFVSIRFEGHL